MTETPLLPHGRLNPFDVDPGATAYVMTKYDPRTGRDGGPGRVFVGHGVPEADWAVGTSHRVRHDQTGRFRGTFTVVGTAHRPRTGPGVTVVGTVPDKTLGLSVFK